MFRPLCLGEPAPPAAAPHHEPAPLWAFGAPFVPPPVPMAEPTEVVDMQLISVRRQRKLKMKKHKYKKLMKKTRNLRRRIERQKN